MKRFFKKVRIFFRLKRQEFVSWVKYNFKIFILLICFLFVWALTAYIFEFYIFIDDNNFALMIILSFVFLIVLFYIIGVLYIFITRFINLMACDWEQAEYQLQMMEQKIINEEKWKKWLKDIPTTKNKEKNIILRDNKNE